MTASLASLAGLLLGAASPAGPSTRGAPLRLLWRRRCRRRLRRLLPRGDTFCFCALIRPPLLLGIDCQESPFPRRRRRRRHRRRISR
jgi:hypothetical protein